jgi:hypothetical protein
MMSPKRKSSDPRQTLVLLLVGTGVLFALCCACWAIAVNIAPDLVPFTGEEPTSTALRLAYSPEKQVLFESLVADFNAQGLASADGDSLQVEAVQMDPEAMVDAALAGEVQAIVPDSSIWIRWTGRTPSALLLGKTSAAERG